ncbi:unnamed protein product [Linum tenue]|uniref:Uncharacterized protein n=1 Tax=Linum tenue TaxID=586396 RepID=A0AAV0IIL0_9ROSI|nr:unnamed protein product [Linum tenue]
MITDHAEQRNVVDTFEIIQQRLQAKFQEYGAKCRDVQAMYDEVSAKLVGLGFQKELSECDREDKERAGRLNDELQRISLEIGALRAKEAESDAIRREFEELMKLREAAILSRVEDASISNDLSHLAI